MEASNSSNGCCDFLSYWPQRIPIGESEQAGFGFDNTKYSFCGIEESESSHLQLKHCVSLKLLLCSFNVCVTTATGNHVAVAAGILILLIMTDFQSMFWLIWSADCIVCTITSSDCTNSESSGHLTGTGCIFRFLC